MKVQIIQRKVKFSVLTALPRTNIDTPDIFIDESDPLESSLETLLNEMVDPTSSHYISSEYVMYRLIECTNRMNSYRNISLRSTMCPLIFDSWTCFNATEAGQYQLESCPQFPHLGFDHNRKVKKYCDLNGEWWVHPDSNK